MSTTSPGTLKVCNLSEDQRNPGAVFLDSREVEHFAMVLMMSPLHLVIERLRDGTRQCMQMVDR